MMEQNKQIPPLIILAGPTAVGKTSLSIALAKAVNGAIISADSMQVYRHMNIGTAKIYPEQMQGIRHYLIDEFEPEEEFHVVRFQEYTKRYLREIYDDKKLPILVGGTGFYIQAILYDIDFTKAESEEAYRLELHRIASEQGANVLHQQLRALDPASAEAIHPNNVKRVIRALEYYHQTGEPISKHNEIEREKQTPYQAAYFALTDTREAIYKRIDQRVDQMMEQGLLDEVKKLKEQGYDRSLVSMQGLGYKELYSYLDKECTLDEAVRLLKQNTRHFAKRQLTWLKREKDVIWLNRSELGSDEVILEQMITNLKRREII